MYILNGGHASFSSDHTFDDNHEFNQIDQTVNIWQSGSMIVYSMYNDNN